MIKTITRWGVFDEKKDVLSGFQLVFCFLALVPWNEASQTSDFVLVHLETGETSCLKSISGEVGTVCALSPQKDRLAYAVSSGEDLNSAVQVIVEDLRDGSQTRLFTEEKNFQWVESLTFLPDGNTLIANVTKGQQWNDTALIQADLTTGGTSVVDQAVFPSNGLEACQTPEEFQELLLRYGGKALPFEERTGFFYVQYSIPSLSQDGKELFYTATLYRSVTPAFQAGDPPPLLWLASGVWRADLTGKDPPSLLYAEPDSRSYLGRVCLSGEGDTLAYSKITCLNGWEKTSSLCLLDRASLESSVLLSPTEENPLYYPRFFWEDRLYLFGVEISLESGEQISYSGMWDMKN